MDMDLDPKNALLNDDDLKELRQYVGPSNEQNPKDIGSKYNDMKKNKK